MPSRTEIIAVGWTKVTVPTWTALAPASMYSMASSAVAMPPQPIIGISTARAHCQVMRTTMGRIAGPDRPPVMLPSLGRWLSISTAMARKVLATTSASAPAASAARAISAMSVTLGDSFTQRGREVRRRIAATARSVEATSLAKALPSSSRLGQEMLASIAATPGRLTSSASSAKPATVGAEMLTTSGVE